MLNFTLSEGQHMQVGASLITICDARAGRVELVVRGDIENVVRRDKIIMRMLQDAGWVRVGGDAWRNKKHKGLFNTLNALEEENLI